MSHRILTVTMILVFAIGAPLEESRTVAPINAVRVGPIKSGPVALGDLLHQLSKNTNVAFCFESRDDHGQSTLGLLSVNLPIEPNEDLQTVLVRLERAYPVIMWTIEAGTIVISSKDIKNNPLDAIIKPSSFQGTLRDLVAYLNSNTDLMASTTEISGMNDSKAVYSLNFKSEMQVREALGTLTSKYGVHWTAAIRDDGFVRLQLGNDPPSEKMRVGRVTLMFSRGRIPLLVR